MQQNNIFVGNLAAPLEMKGENDKLICKFTLIANEYIGKDPSTNESKYREVSIRFTGFGKVATRLEKALLVGDQVITSFSISNNNYEREGKMVYGHNFIVQDFQLGAPGKARKERT
ncbi:single-stranded DNA-binding protein [Yersinia massiliensis]|uniref:Single-stranded DNA-binding protein n=1 Tax=Yersinia massiliensis TaxID=419257 RepID=A0ABM6V0Z7_9GAMM|nr:single-stranded DNA-binding protein [Yersinia massiliensis]AVX40711.1 single-stranded DNA-binding protein [Yersinia massiliensis]